MLPLAVIVLPRVLYRIPLLSPSARSHHPPLPVHHLGAGVSLTSSRNSHRLTMPSLAGGPQHSQWAATSNTASSSGLLLGLQVLMLVLPCCAPPPARASSGPCPHLGAQFLDASRPLPPPGRLPSLPAQGGGGFLPRALRGQAPRPQRCHRADWPRMSKGLCDTLRAARVVSRRPEGVVSQRCVFKSWFQFAAYHREPPRP